MKIDIKNLPTNVTLLHQIIADLATEVDWLQSKLNLLRAKHFGKSSEKLDNEIADIELRIEEAESLGKIVTTVEDPSENENEKQQPKRQKLPEQLPREQIILEAPTVCSGCGGKDFRKISDDKSEMLEYVPSSFKVVQYVRPRCACVACDKIIQAYPPSNPISKGKAGSGLLAHILIQKYCNHLPFYRQSQIYEREGIELSRSTMSSWAGQCATLLEPLIGKLKESIFASSQIHGDDTPVRVLAPGLGKTKTGRIWAYVRDGRPHSDTTPPAVCYFYSPDRKGERPREHLKDFTGILHADAYSGYDKLYGDNITEAACWAHTRRKFYEITVASDNAKVAYATLEKISEIYKIEEGIKGFDPKKRQEARQESSKKLVDDLFTSFKAALTKLPKKSATTLAINYAMNNQAALMRFLDNGKIEIDNNAAERAMRSIALGRKNWLFAGSDNGGQTVATIYSLVETAKLNKINPQIYLSKVLSVIQDHKSTKLAELLPWNIVIPDAVASG